MTGHCKAGQPPIRTVVRSLMALLMLTVFAGRAATAREDQPVLADSTWRLVEIRSMDGNQGVRRPATPSRYSLRLEADGSAQLRLDCNRAQGAWSISPGTDPSIGGFRFGPLATTKALCPQPSLGEALGAQLPAVRGYALRGGLLSLRMKGDAGLLLFEPLPSTEVRYRAAADPLLEEAIRRRMPDYRRELVGEDPRRWARYVHAATDLDGDGQEEMLVYLMGSWFCGTGGCTLHIYRPSAEGYDLVQDIPLSRMPVVAADSHSEGWRDLWQLQSGGGMPAGFIRYQFDGSRYRQTERIPADQGRPEGLLLLSGNPSLADGQPLEPQQ